MPDQEHTCWGRLLMACMFVIFLFASTGCGSKSRSTASQNRGRPSATPRSERMAGRVNAPVVGSFEDENREEERRLWDRFVREQSEGRTHESFDEFKLRLTQPPADAMKSVEDADLTAEMKTLNSMYIPERTQAGKYPDNTGPVW